MLPASAYAPHEVLVAPARPTRQIWRLVAGLLTGAVLVIALNAALGTLLLAIGGRTGRDVAAGLGESAGSLLILLGSFGFVTLSVAIVLILFHRRGMAGVLGPARPLIRDFARVLGALALLGLVLFLLPPWGAGLPLEPNLAFGLWLSLLPLSLLGLLIQTSAEEILFRGYIQQQLAARFASPLVWMVLPSALFALGHYIPVQAGPNAVWIALWSGIFGMLMADLTARAGNLGPAIAVHFANNFSSLLIVSLPDGLSGLSLYTVRFAMDDPEAIRVWLPVDFATMIVGWLAARLAIRR